MFTRRADVAVYDRERKLVLIVEAKSRFDATQRWAPRTLRNLYAHQVFPDVSYFLLALPDFFYLWKNPGQKIMKDPVAARERIDPDRIVPAREIIQPYLGGQDVPPQEISTYAMEMVVNAWVADLLNSNYSRETVPAHLRWLFDIGLYQAMRGGFLATEAVV